MPDYEETYNAVMSLPCVQRLIKKNKKLRKENKSLRNLIQLLPEFRNQSNCSYNSNLCYTDDTVPIKIEKTSNDTIKSVNIPVENIDSDIEIVVPNTNLKENIVYDIIEDGSETTPEESAEEEEEVEYIEVTEESAEEEEEAEEEEVEESAEEEEEAEEEEVEESAEEEEVEESAEEEEVEESAEEEEEEAEEEEVEEEEEEEEESEYEEEEEESAEEEEEEELEVFEITINGTEYYTTNETNGVIYAVDADSDVGDEIGKFVNKKPVFY